MSFRSIFVAVFLGTALVAAALVLNARRPALETAQPTAALVRAGGKCAECHRNETAAVVVEYERSRHAAKGVNCLECHRPAAGQQGMEHRGFEIVAHPTALNCAGCHADQYRQFLRSRHAAPAWAAVRGPGDFTPEQIAESERYHPGAVNRAANVLARLEGEPAIVKGCASCHAVGRPNADGSIGSCTQCHARHIASIAQARLPETCGQCHMGPDHSQIEIYSESKHGVLFAAQRDRMDLSARPGELTVAKMPVPTCATCHMSGLGGQKSTHDTSERLSYWLFADISERRPNYLAAQNAMQDVCNQCHVAANTSRFYAQAEAVVADTNEKIRRGQAVMKALADDGLLTPAPFDEPIEFTAFDFWHYYGRTAKHGAFMGGADFVQWHGNYELLLHQVELEAQARELRASRGPGGREAGR